LTDLISYKNAHGLVETTDPDVDRPLCRKPGFEGIDTLGEMDEKLSAFLRRKREELGLSRDELAPMLGISRPVYGRYERAFSRLTVTRMIHLCELLGFMPTDMLYEAAPHLWGKTPEEAEDRVTLTKLIERMPHDTIRDLIRLLKRMTPGELAPDAPGMSDGGR
jgi:transcriptional regulator with XRE-family HTH domain